MAQTEQDRRRQSRALTAALVEIIDNYQDRATCVLEDLSSSGACVHSDIAMDVGVQVTLRVGSITHSGVTKYCMPREGGFSVGLSFVGGDWPGPIGYPIHWIPKGA